MYSIYETLVLGDVPGDPELGGWRPLPKDFFLKLSPLPVPSCTMSLEQAVRLINFECRYLRLLRAVQKVNFDLLQTRNSFVEVRQCS
jgi:hypothetical protein